MNSPAKRFTATQAALAIVISVFSLSLGDALIKASTQSLPLWQMFALRSGLAVPVLWWLALKIGTGRRRVSIWIILRSAMMAVMWLCYYMSLPLVPLSTAAAVYYSAPLFIVAFASLVARKPPKRLTLIAIVGGFCGVVLVIQPDVSDFEAAALLPLISAILYAGAMVLTAAKCQGDNPFVLAMMLNVALVVTGLGVGVFSGREGSFILGPWQTMDLVLAGTVLLLALSMLIGSVGAAIAYQNGPPATVASFDYSYLVFSVTWGALFFHEFPGLAGLIGVSLIICAGLLALPKDRRST